jgi:hypothetical protein
MGSEANKPMRWISLRPSLVFTNNIALIIVFVAQKSIFKELELRGKNKAVNGFWCEKFNVNGIIIS